MISRPLTEKDAQKFADLLIVVRDLRAIPAPSPRAEFVSDLRERLLTEADTALLPRAARPLTAEEQRLVLPVRSYQRDRRLAAVLGAAALVGATTSVAVAAQTALPGQSLYPVKRAIENTQTGLARDDTARGQALLANARGRLDEVRDLAASGGPGSISSMESTLSLFTEQASEASDAMLAAYDESGDTAVITELRSFTGSSIERLSLLEPTLPDAARDDVVAAGARLVDIDARARQLCPECEGGVASIPTNLLTAGRPSSGVTTVIVAASQNPGLLKPVKTQPPKPASPDPVSGEDVGDIEVPDLDPPDTTALPTPTPNPVPTPTPTPTLPTGKPTPVKVDVKTPVNDVTKLLTGDLSTVTGVVPGANEVLTGVGTTLDGTVNGVQGTLDSTTGSLLP